LMVFALVFVTVQNYLTGTSSGKKEISASQKNLNGLQSMLFASQSKLEVLKLRDSNDGRNAYFDEGIVSITRRVPSLLYFKESPDSVVHSVMLSGALLGSSEWQKTISFANAESIVFVNDSTAFLYDVSRGDIGILVSRKNMQLALSDQYQLRVLFTTKDGDTSNLHIRYPGCSTEHVIRLNEGTQDMTKYLHEHGLPIQRQMQFSPSQDRVLLIDHSAQSTLTLVDLLSLKKDNLFVPFLGVGQIHYSPIFLDDEHLAFSVIDGHKWMTLSYNISSRTYKILSQNFSDDIFVSSTGKIILVQSFFARALNNVPFGSRVFAQGSPCLPSKEVDGLLGNDRSWMSVLEEVNSMYCYTKSVNRDVINNLPNELLRRRLLSVWEEQTNLDIAIEAITAIVQEVQEGQQYEVVERSSFHLLDGMAYNRFIQDVSPLLRILEVPREVISAYSQLLRYAKQNSEELLFATHYL
ncbi:MAG: hypothetical protein WC790_03245, partial [Candidatus Paceibacterota bacterium]